MCDPPREYNDAYGTVNSASFRSEGAAAGRGFRHPRHLHNATQGMILFNASSVSEKSGASPEEEMCHRPSFSLSLSHQRARESF